jgi:hypothetical protein
LNGRFIAGHLRWHTVGIIYATSEGIFQPYVDQIPSGSTAFRADIGLRRLLHAFLHRLDSGLAGSRYALLTAPGALDSFAIARTLIVSRMTFVQIHRAIRILVVL